MWTTNDQIERRLQTRKGFLFFKFCSFCFCQSALQQRPTVQSFGHLLILEYWHKRQRKENTSSKAFMNEQKSLNNRKARVVQWMHWSSFLPFQLKLFSCFWVFTNGVEQKKSTDHWTNHQQRDCLYVLHLAAGMLMNRNRRTRWRVRELHHHIATVLERLFVAETLVCFCCLLQHVGPLARSRQ